MAVLAGIIAVLVVLVVGLLVWLLIVIEKGKKSTLAYFDAVRALRTYKEGEVGREAAIRKDAIARSTSVVKGKVAEHLVPWIRGFDFNPRDCRFIGAPIDFLVFEGMTEGDLDRIVFVEVKTGESRLSKRERQIRDTVSNAEMAFLTCRVAEDGSIISWSS